MKNYFSMVLAIFAIQTTGFCGGSVDWDFHALPILKAHPDLLRVITSSLDVSRIGLGVRLGKDFGDQQGMRIPPYEFPARLKGSTGSYNLILVIHDPSGMHEEGENGTWIEVRERSPSECP